LQLLVEQTLLTLGAEPERTQALRSPGFISKLEQAAWPGNVRELRNYLERCLVFEDAVALSDVAPQGGRFEVDAKVAYAEARRLALDDFERRYLRALLALHQGKVSQAASSADMDRVYLYRLLRRHGIK
jgi:two-component system, NtrC family, response regulator GlrR